MFMSKNSSNMESKQKLTLNAISKSQLTTKPLSLGLYRIVKLKLKISYEAAKRHISVLELFINAIVSILSGKVADLRDTERGEGEDIVQIPALKAILFPLVIVDKLYQVAKEGSLRQNPAVTDLARLSGGIQARLRYQREKFERYLMIQTSFQIDVTDKIPYELKIQKLPVSYHFYDSVPIMMAKYIGTNHLQVEALERAVSKQNLPSKTLFSCFKKQSKEEKRMRAKMNEHLNLKKMNGFETWSKERVDIFLQQMRYLTRVDDEAQGMINLQNKTFLMK